MMPQYRDKIKVNDKQGFVYEVEVHHTPQFGFSTAYYNGRIIGQCELGGRMHEPMSDDDREWEMYEERFEDWRCEIIDNIQRICSEHFNNRK